MLRSRALSRFVTPLALLLVVCTAAVVAVLAGAAPSVPATLFANNGHWIYNSALDKVFHLNGATSNLDVAFEWNAESDSVVLQNDSSVFIAGSDGVTEIDKATQAQDTSVDRAAAETPLGLQVVGGPYVVYREAGVIDRLGDDAARIDAGGRITDPVVTENGTMWLLRTETNEICVLARDARELGGCPVTAPADHNGTLAVVGGKPAFIDSFTDELYTVEGGVLGEGRPLGVDLTPAARPAVSDANGRLAILDGDRLHLVNTTSRTEPPPPVPLPPGNYSTPVMSGDAVVVLDEDSGIVRTFDTDGREKPEKRFDDPRGGDDAGRPRVVLGEDDRIYVEDADGTQVVVVDKDGRPGDPVDVDRVQPTTTTRPENPRPSSDRPPAQEDPRGDPRRQAPPRLPPSRPGAPIDVFGRPGNASVTLSWRDAPANGSPITGYTVSWSGGATNVTGTSTPIRGLTNGTSYTFRVVARNAAGAGPAASSNPVTPVAPTPQPRVVLTKGPKTDETCGGDPDCAFMHISMTGFPPNAAFTAEARSVTDPDYSNDVTLEVDPDGTEEFDRFAFDNAGAVVYVVVTCNGKPYRSGNLTW